MRILRTSCVEPQNQHVGSLCFCGLLGPYHSYLQRGGGTGKVIMFITVMILPILLIAPAGLSAGCVKIYLRTHNWFFEMRVGSKYSYENPNHDYHHPHPTYNSTYIYPWTSKMRAPTLLAVCCGYRAGVVGFAFGVWLEESPWYDQTNSAFVTIATLRNPFWSYP